MCSCLNISIIKAIALSTKSSQENQIVYDMTQKTIMLSALYTEFAPLVHSCANISG